MLTVKKNYRDVPYHNWTHAFAVAHSMYLVIRSGNDKFTALEVKGSTMLFTTRLLDCSTHKLIYLSGILFNLDLCKRSLTQSCHMYI